MAQGEVIINKHNSPYRVEYQRYGHADRTASELALNVGKGVISAVATNLLKGPRGFMAPAPAILTSRHAETSERSRIVPGLQCRYPGRVAAPEPEFWLLDEHALAEASLSEPDMLARACADSLRTVLDGTSYWGGKHGVFRSGNPRISYRQLVASLEASPCMNAEAPTTAADFADRIVQIGSEALRLATGGPGFDNVQLLHAQYEFIPSVQALHPLVATWNH